MARVYRDSCVDTIKHGLFYCTVMYAVFIQINAIRLRLAITIGYLFSDALTGPLMGMDKRLRVLLHLGLF